MPLIMLLAMLQTDPAAELHLLCTTTPNGAVVRYVFEIDATARSYSATMNDTYQFVGPADVSESTIHFDADRPRSSDHVYNQQDNRGSSDGCRADEWLCRSSARWLLLKI